MFSLKNIFVRQNLSSVITYLRHQFNELGHHFHDCFFSCVFQCNRTIALRSSSLVKAGMKLNIKASRHLSAWLLALSAAVLGCCLAVLQCWAAASQCCSAGLLARSAAVLGCCLAVLQCWAGASQCCSAGLLSCSAAVLG